MKRMRNDGNPRGDAACNGPVGGGSVRSIAGECGICSAPIGRSEAAAEVEAAADLHGSVRPGIGAIPCNYGGDRPPGGGGGGHETAPAEPPARFSSMRSRLTQPVPYARVQCCDRKSAVIPSASQIAPVSHLRPLFSMSSRPTPDRPAGGPAPIGLDGRIAPLPPAARTRALDLDDHAPRRLIDDHAPMGLVKPQLSSEHSSTKSEVSMRRIVSGPLALVVLATSPTYAFASTRVGPGEEDEDLVVIDEEMEGEEAPAKTPEGETPPAEGETPPAEGEGDIDIFGEEEGASEDATPTEPAGKADKDSEEKQIKAEMGLITVVQRQRMLKKGRFELSPQVGITVNDPYVRHYTLGLDLNYWLTNRMAIGLTGTGLIGAKTPRYDNIRFQEGLLLTANQILWQASVNYTYNPFYGKIAIFNRALLHWEGSLVVGGGAMQTRVLPRYESIHDPFSTVTGGGHIGVQGRFYGRRIDWLSVNWGVRTWLFADKLEPIQRGPGDADDGSGDDPTLNDAAAAKDAADFQIGYNVIVYLGVSFYFPTSFEYTTPR
jgi:outer membrane beta-barrel protein